MPEKELDYLQRKEDSSSDEALYEIGGNTTQLTGWAKFKDSFKENDAAELGLDPNLSDVEKAAILTANSPLSRSLKNRHMQMIAIGGSIGSGLFVGSGQTLAQGGPAGIIIAYGLVGSMIFCTCQSLGELAITFPVAGGFLTYNTRFIDPSFGFAVAWVYSLSWIFTLPLELVAAAITINFWDASINPVAFVAIFYFIIVVINLFGVRGYGEAEFLFSLIKVIAVVGFIILGIVLICGGGPDHHFIGGKYWRNPGAFANGFKGVCSVFVTAAFAFSGTELVGLAAAESENPRRSLPKAVRQVFWRIFLFYIGSLIVVGLLVPYNDPLLNGNGAGAADSPFVIAIKNAGIKVLPSIMNVVVMIAVLSVGNASVFAASRAMASLAVSGQAPKIIGYIDKKGRPLVAIIIQFICGLLCFISASKYSTDVFTWLLSLAGLASLFVWGSINICLIRFRSALKSQGRGVDELTFTSQTGIIGAYWGAILNVLCVIAQFWVAVWPIGELPNATTFFQLYISLPLAFFFYFAHKIWKRNWILYIRARDIDIDTGRRELDLDLLKQEIAEEKRVFNELPWYGRLYNSWC